VSRREQRRYQQWNAPVLTEASLLLAVEDPVISKQADVRYADDAGMNREMREVERWNDPAA